MPAAKKGAKTAVYAVAGSDEAEVKRSARELAAKLMPEGGEFACDTIDGVADNADGACQRIHETIQALLTLPFFGAKLVWLKNANFFADSVTGRAESVLEAAEKLGDLLGEGLPENVTFLLSAPEIDKRRAFYKRLQKVGTVVVHDRLETGRAGWEEAAGDLAAERARERKLRFSGEALELFALLTGGDKRQIETELEKIDLYLGSSRRDVTLEDVRKLVPLSRAGVIFELGNAIAARDLQRCLKLLEQLLYQGETAMGILLATIVPTVRNLLLVKDLMERHRLRRPQQANYFANDLNRLPEEATAHLPRKKDGAINAYGLGVTAMHAHRYSVEELRRALGECLDANVALVSGGMEATVVLSQLVVRVVAARA